MATNNLLINEMRWDFCNTPREENGHTNTHTHFKYTSTNGISLPAYSYRNPNSVVTCIENSLKDKNKKYQNLLFWARLNAMNCLTGSIFL